MIDYDNSQFLVYDQLPVLEGYQSIPVHIRGEALFVDVTSFIGDSSLQHSFFSFSRVIRVDCSTMILFRRSSTLTINYW